MAQANLAGLHDREAVAIADDNTWIVDTVALSENPSPPLYVSRLNWIVRLNWGYGSTGTLPPAAQYSDFALRCAEYAKNAGGCHRWIIGNETNLPREWPQNKPIHPMEYADCFTRCRRAIRNVPGHERDEVLVAGSGPWNNELKYDGNPTGDWVAYFADCLRLLKGDYDGFALHAYTHGYDPALVTSDATMDAPFKNRYFEFRTYRNYCAAISEGQRHKPAYITEANGDGPWQAVGLMPAMLTEINEWNKASQPRIHCVAFYRYPRYDNYYIEGRGDVIAEYHRAVQLGYGMSTEEPPKPMPPTPTPPAIDRYFDPALVARGVQIVQPSLAPGELYWFADHLEWLDLKESQGRHHIYGNVTDAAGQPMYGVKLKVSWPSGDTLVETKQDAASPYSYNYPMSKSLNEFRIEVVGGAFKSELVTGIGMGMNGNPAEHTSTVVNWKLRKHTGVVVPPDPPKPIPPKPTPDAAVFFPAVGGVITGRFGEPYKPQDGPAYLHEGLDIAAPLGSHVLAAASGVVAFNGFDKNYGNYVRIFHKERGAFTFYGHMQEPSPLAVGSVVRAGQRIGKVGSTGNSSGPHLHFEVRTCTEDGSYVDTCYGFLKGRCNPETALWLWGLR